MTTNKAVRATIKLGNIELDGYQMPDGTYNFSLSQMEDQLGISQRDRTGKKVLKPLLETNICSVTKSKIEGNNATATLIHIDLFSQIIAEYVKLGNERCLAIVVACFTESLERRFDSAFGVQRSENERNERLAARTQGKVARRYLSDSIADYLTNHPELSDNYRKFVWSLCSDHLNKIILGAKAKQAKEFLEVPKNSLLRNHIPIAALNELERVEDLASRIIDEKGTEPLEAVKEAAILMFTKTIGMI